MKLCWNMLGMAIRLIFLNIEPEKSITFPSVFTVFKRLIRVIKDRIPAIPWHIKVAQATPSIPMPNTTTKNQSKNMLPKEDPIRKYRGVFESPKALNIPVHMLYKNRNMRPPIYILI